MILGIESSCDDSGLAVFDSIKNIVDEIVHSQLELHEVYGGVVPALASREHSKNFPPLLQSIKGRIDLDKIDSIAVTYGPGLAGCLALGIAFANGLSVALDVPIVGVNHFVAHALSPFISLHESDPSGFEVSLKSFLPHLGLIVSGGNTTLFKIDESLTFETIALTVDDAAGEALDKGAKLLGMSYPGGALIEEKAEKGNPRAIDFPQAFRSASEPRFSFSGLKTSLRYYLEKIDDEELENTMSDICASYQHAVMEALIRKTSQALDANVFSSIGLSGGVSNNKNLRGRFEELAGSHNIPCLMALPRHTGDNAAMVAFAAYAAPHLAVASNDFDLSFYPALKLT